LWANGSRARETFVEIEQLITGLNLKRPTTSEAGAARLQEE
jgi:hypothetical protein